MPSTKTLQGATLAGYLGTKTDPAPNSAYSLTGVPPVPAAPVLTAIVPTATTIGNPGFILECNGSGFTDASVIMWDGSPDPTVFVSASKVTTNVETTAILIPGTVQITVRNAGGAVTAPQTLTVT